MQVSFTIRFCVEISSLEDQSYQDLQSGRAEYSLDQRKRHDVVAVLADLGDSCDGHLLFLFGDVACFCLLRRVGEVQESEDCDRKRDDSVCKDP